MREIKFRAWDKKQGRMIKPDAIWLENHEISIDTRFYKDIILMQYTGLKDKNGKEIWEGDIVIRNNTTIFGSTPPSVVVIIYDENNAKFWVTNTKHLDTKYFRMFDLSKNWRVVGNIYENPELIGGKK